MTHKGAGTKQIAHVVRLTGIAVYFVSAHLEPRDVVESEIVCCAIFLLIVKECENRREQKGARGQRGLTDWERVSCCFWSWGGGDILGLLLVLKSSTKTLLSALSDPCKLS